MREHSNIETSILGFDSKPFLKSISKLKIIDHDLQLNLGAEKQNFKKSIEYYHPPKWYAPSEKLSI
jgi:hypothetical protein